MVGWLLIEGDLAFHESVIDFVSVYLYRLVAYCCSMICSISIPSLPFLFSPNSTNVHFLQLLVSQITYYLAQISISFPSSFAFFTSLLSTVLILIYKKKYYCQLPNI